EFVVPALAGPSFPPPKGGTTNRTAACARQRLGVRMLLHRSLHASLACVCQSRRDCILQPSPVLRGQGCDEGATLGIRDKEPSTPTGLRQGVGKTDATPLGLIRTPFQPRVAPSSQPWAE